MIYYFSQWQELMISVTGTNIIISNLFISNHPITFMASSIV